jgi:hypothetical protein
MTHKYVLPLYLLVCVGTAFCEEPRRTPQQLVELSRKATDLSEIGPYRLQAKIVLTPPDVAKEKSGQITVLRDKDRYRSELQIGGFRETRWIKDNMLYVDRSQLVPLPMTTLLGKLDRLWRANLIPSDAKVSAVSRQEGHGKDLECFEIKGKSWSHKSCFDRSTSVLVREDGGFDFYDLEFQDFAAMDQKFFPRRIIVRDSGHVVVDVREISVTKAAPTPDAFAPPAVLPGLDTCDEPTPPIKIKDAVPNMPRDQLRMMHDATVYVFAIVGTGGSIQGPAVEYSPDVSFSASALDAAKQWRYAPAMCVDKAVPAEIELRVQYSTR